MIGEGDEVGGPPLGGGSTSREDQMTKSDKLCAEQSGLTKKASDSPDNKRHQLNRQKSFTCVKVKMTLHSFVEERQFFLLLKLQFYNHNVFGTSNPRQPE